MIFPHCWAHICHICQICRFLGSHSHVLHASPDCVRDASRLLTNQVEQALSVLCCCMLACVAP